MKLIVGLGNPGPKYQMTRHNIGFLFIDALVEVFDGGRRFKNEHQAETQKFRIGDQQILAAKPQTFMNKSGESVQALAHMYKIEMADILVVHDEVDLPFKQLRFHTKRSPAGNNGIKSVHQMLGTDTYGRLRLGVDRPPTIVDDEGKKIRPAMDVADWVLHNFSREEIAQLPDFLEHAMDGLEVWVKDGLDAAATRFNGGKNGA